MVGCVTLATVDNSCNIIEIVTRGPQGASGDPFQFAGGSTGQVWTKLPDGTYGWADHSDDDVNLVRGNTPPPEFDQNNPYSLNDRITYNGKEYRYKSQNTTTSVFDANLWQEVSTNSNELRIDKLEEGSGSGRIVITEYSFTETTKSMWTVNNIGSSETEFLSSSVEILFNGVKLRKDNMWVNSTTIRVPYESVVNEDYLTVRVTTVSNAVLEPIETEYTQTVASNYLWAVTGIGGTQYEFDSPKIQIYYNGVRMRKGTQAIWVSPTEIRIKYNSVASEDYLTIRVDA